MKGLPMDTAQKQKIAKIVVKQGIGFVFACLMGYTYKLSKKADERIDNYFAPEPEATSKED